MRQRRPRKLQKSSQKTVRVVQARACIDEGDWKGGRQDRDVHPNALNNQQPAADSNWGLTNCHLKRAERPWDCASIRLEDVGGGTILRICLGVTK